MKPPLRFSLLGLFTVTTVVALAVSLYLTMIRLVVAEAEVDRLRRETGHLKIGDAGQVHVIAVPTMGALHWRWRVHLPGGHDFGFFAYRGRFDKQGFPEQGVMAVHDRMGGQSNPKLPREILVDVAFDKTLGEGSACLRIRENGGGSSVVRFNSTQPSWLTDKMYSEQVAAQGDPLAVDVGTPLGLLKLDGYSAQGETSDDAVLIWIGPYEHDPTNSVRSLRDKGVLPMGRSLPQGS